MTEEGGGGGRVPSVTQIVNPLADFAAAIALKQKRLSKLNRSRKLFLLAMPATGVLAQMSLVLSVCSADWVRTEEKMPNKNRTVLFGPNKSPEYLPKLTYSGLFDLCYTRPGEKNYSCIKIDYFPTEDYLPDQNDSTMAISHVVINSAYFFFAALVVLSVAQLLGSVGLCVPKKKILTFVSGVVFIIAGLVLFVGQVFYISLLKGEVGGKLSPVSLLSPPRFTYRYGWSFLLLIASFLSAEAAGTSAIFFFMYHHQYRYVGRQSLRESFQQRDEHTKHNGWAVRHLSNNSNHSVVPPDIKKEIFDPIKSNGNHHHHHRPFCPKHSRLLLPELKPIHSDQYGGSSNSVSFAAELPRDETSLTYMKPPSPSFHGRCARCGFHLLPLSVTTDFSVEEMREYGKEEEEEDGSLSEQLPWRRRSSLYDLH